MVLKCPHCQFEKPDVPVGKNILKVLADPQLPLEDYLLWIERLVTMYGISAYQGVKIHIGIMHKNQGNDPMFVLTEEESKIINVAEANARTS